MPDVVCLGELLIDFVSLEKGVSLLGSYGFKKAAGGAPSNVAVGLSRLGHSVAVISKVGNDPFGEFLIETLVKNMVDVSQVSRDLETRTALAFVSLRGNGERDFLFYRHPSADMKLSSADIRPEAIEHSRIFHYGSISMISEESHHATLHAVHIAKKAGCLISYDPNLRIALWESKEKAMERIGEGVQLAHIVKMNREELSFLTGLADPESGSKRLLSQGPLMVVVTLDEKGCYYKGKLISGSVGAFQVKPVDTTGAGDGFMAGLLSGILSRFPSAIHLNELSQDTWESILRFANAVGAMTTLKRGAIPSLPYLKQVHRFLKKKPTLKTEGPL